jgi:hypothetical protein
MQTLKGMSGARVRKKDGSEDQGQAAYGLRLLGLRGLVGGRPAPSDWEAWTVRQVVEPGCELEGERMTVWEDRALIPLAGLGRITVDRDRHEIVFATVRPLSDEAVLHPGLVPGAAVVNSWKGRACVHAAAVTAGGGVWALLADRGGGKSTTAALLAGRAHAFFTDDMLIVEGTRCFAGPASVDLREDASEELGGASIGVIGERERWRKPVPGAPAEAPLGGLIELVWTDGAASVDELDLADRIELAGRHLSMPVDGEHLLALASRPALRFARPLNLDGAATGLELLRQAIGPP